ncbi:Glycine cleavage system transcriptional activator [Roseovarius albus]|uniref:Glycine cleavage system transcriptional activator n=1 Tax=Roseovarius albus TaxID=1247867 RepID=A0A1X6ZDE0_9RHOB|nr:LysR substrate-binding domain-containing protein [Roseovarius albus]SLN46483.1 Glycine cleavage system transcriptional activator [Roseovarius albus]
MKRKLPPFPALRAFEAAARLGSFKSAASELCVTPSAISHQVSLLETYIGKSMFVRQSNRVELTPDGQHYLTSVGPILDDLDASTRAVIGEPQQGQLRLKMTEWFAKRWFIPRLSNFLCTYPDIDVKIETGLPPTDFRNGELDIVIHWEDAPVPGAVIEPFFTSGRTPVCTPQYLASHPSLKRPHDLQHHVLLRDETSDGWQEWFDLAGAPQACPSGGPVFAHCELSTNAALNNAGIVLSYTALIDDFLKSGALRPIFDLHTPVRTLYSLAYEQCQSNSSHIMIFREWLFGQVLQDSSNTLAA